MSTLSTRTWGFHSQLFFFHFLWTQPIFAVVRAVWNKSQKSLISFRTAGLFAWKVTSFALCCYVIGLFNRPQGTHKHNVKECGSVVSIRFFWGSVVWHPKKWLQRRLPSPRLNRVLRVGGWAVGRIHWMIWMQVQGSIKVNEAAWLIHKICVALTSHSGCEQQTFWTS